MTPRFPKKIYLTADCLKALSLISTASQSEDAIVESAIWEKLSTIPGLTDCITAQNEAVRKFKEQNKTEEEQ